MNKTNNILYIKRCSSILFFYHILQTRQWAEWGFFSVLLYCTFCTIAMICYCNINYVNIVNKECMILMFQYMPLLQFKLFKSQTNTSRFFFWNDQQKMDCKGNGFINACINLDVLCRKTFISYRNIQYRHT